ncbi:MAG: hypothetical protein ACLP7O_09655 [Terracidiphilus sp.]
MSTILQYALPIIAGGLIFTAAGMIYSVHKITSIWLYFTGAVICFAAICLHWQQVVRTEEENPPFSVAFETSYIGTTRDSGLFGAITSPRVFCPVPVAVYVRIVNLQRFPADIDQLKIELQVTKGKWLFPASWIEALPIPDYAPLVSPGPRSQGLKVDLHGTRLLPRLESGAIQPRQTIRGWLLLDMPPEYDSAPKPLTYRISLRDTAGNKFTTISPDPNTAANVGPERGLIISDGIDLSGYSVHHIIDLQHAN